MSELPFRVSNPARYVMRRRTATVGTIGLIVAACAFTAGGQEELPPLSAPLDIAIPDDPEPKPEPKAEPAPQPKPKAKPSAAESRRPVLVVPGLPRPKSRTVAPVAKPAAAPVVEEAIPKLEPIDDGLPPLVGPADEAVAPEPTFDLTPSLDASDEVLPPLTLEAEPSDAEAEAKKPSTKDATPKDVRPAPRRRLFGLLPPVRNRYESRPSGGSKIEFDPRSDPAADAALKRRVERVIRESAGPHVRSAEVSVVDRSIVIRARADRFYNRRAVKRQLESLPGLAGYSTRVEIVE